MPQRLVLSESDGYWLAGFMEAAGSFSIRPNNFGQTWSCGFSLCQRDDEFALLSDLQDRTGLGILRPKPAVGHARPQVEWSITRKQECQLLVSILGRFSLQGRKGAEFALWARAVRLWVDISLSSPDRWTRMAQLGQRLHHARVYTDRPPGASVAPAQDLGLRWFIGGFVTGEGCFSLPSDRPPRFTLKLRRDDRPLLEVIRAATGLGYVWDGPAHGSSRPTSSWIVLRHSELSQLSAYLTGTLRGRRGRELEAWRVSAAEFGRAAGERRPRRRQVLAEAHQRFCDAREYRPPPARRIRRVRSTSREAIIQALRTWAGQHPGALACTAYTEWRTRNPGHPSRNTVTRVFGSWATALTEAGLQDRGAPRQARAAGAPGRSRAETETRVANQRLEIIRAVRALARERGHTPGASEYFAWRLERRRKLPSQATTYRVFPGGWRSVLSAAGVWTLKAAA